MKINPFTLIPSVLVSLLAASVVIGAYLTAAPGVSPTAAGILTVAPFAACALFLFVMEALTDQKTRLVHNLLTGIFVMSPTITIPMLVWFVESGERWGAILPVSSLMLVAFMAGLLVQAGVQAKKEHAASQALPQEEGEPVATT